MSRTIVLALAALPLIAACAPAPVMCFLAAPDQYGDAPPPRAVMMRSSGSGLGCVVVNQETFFVLPQGETVAGSLEADGEGARLTVTGVRFRDDGVQERLTMSAMVALPLALPISAADAIATLRYGRPGGPVEERVLPLDLLRLDAVGDDRVAGYAELGGAGVDFVTFDAPASLAPGL